MTVNTRLVPRLVIIWLPKLDMSDTSDTSPLAVYSSRSDFDLTKQEPSQHKNEICQNLFFL